MRIAIAQAYNGLHKKFSKILEDSGFKTCYFDIDNANWLENAKRTKADIFIWHADDKGVSRHLILDRVYFIEKYLKKRIFPDLNMYYSFNDKIKQYNILSHLKIPVVPTYISFNKEQALNKIKTSKYPIVIKDAYGFGGKGVLKVTNKKEAIGILEDAFKKTKYEGMSNYIYIQKFLSGIDRDLRIITIGDKIATAYWRITKNGEWRANVGKGGEVSFNNIPKNVLKLCLSISKKMNYHWMSYDCFVINGKIYVGEFSCNFGVKGPRAHGIDIREMQMKYLTKYLRK